MCQHFRLVLVRQLGIGDDGFLSLKTENILSSALNFNVRDFYFLIRNQRWNWEKGAPLFVPETLPGTTSQNLIRALSPKKINEGAATQATIGTKPNGAYEWFAFSSGLHPELDRRFAGPSLGRLSPS